jgi:hypothetical protein
MHELPPTCIALHGAPLCEPRVDEQQQEFLMEVQMIEVIQDLSYNDQLLLLDIQLVIPKRVVVQMLGHQRQVCRDLHPHQRDHSEFAQAKLGHHQLAHPLQGQRRLLNLLRQQLHMPLGEDRSWMYGSYLQEKLCRHRQSLYKYA